MTPIQQLEVRAGVIRARLAEIGGLEDLDDETRGELVNLRNEYQTNEHRQTALKIAGDVPPTPLETRSGEGAEFRGMLQRANVGQLLCRPAGEAGHFRRGSGIATALRLAGKHDSGCPADSGLAR